MTSNNLTPKEEEALRKAREGIATCEQFIIPTGADTTSTHVSMLMSVVSDYVGTSPYTTDRLIFASKIAGSLVQEGLVSSLVLHNLLDMVKTSSSFGSFYFLSAGTRDTFEQLYQLDPNIEVINVCRMLVLQFDNLHNCPRPMLERAVSRFMNTRERESISIHETHTLGGISGRNSIFSIFALPRPSLRPPNFILSSALQLSQFIGSPTKDKLYTLPITEACYSDQDLDDQGRLRVAGTTIAISPLHLFNAYQLMDSSGNIASRSSFL